MRRLVALAYILSGAAGCGKEPPHASSSAPLDVAEASPIVPAKPHHMPAPVPNTRSVAQKPTTATASDAPLQLPAPLKKQVAVATTATEPVMQPIGFITGFRSPTINLFPNEYSTEGTTAIAAQIQMPLPVIERSSVNLRLKARTSSGVVWIAPTDVEFSGQLSQGQPAIRPKKHSAGGRGID